MSFSPASFAPRATRPDERSPFPDLVRGAALLGIGLVNVHLMCAPYFSAQADLSLWTDPVNVAVQGGVSFFFESTAFLMFSALFGAGFLRLMEKRTFALGAGLGYYWRRLAVLAGLGLLHLGLLWYGDVLLLYALCGALLFPFRDCRERTLWIWLAVAALTPLLALAGLGALFSLATLADPSVGSEAWQADTLAGLMLRREELIAAYASGTWGEIFRVRLGEVGDAWWTLPFFLPQIFAGMLLGLILGRRGVLTEPERHGEFYRRIFGPALVLAILGKGYYALHSREAELLPDASSYVLLLASTIGGLAMTFVYLAALRALWLSGVARRLVKHVVAAGRMALTHYLAQSLVATTLFYSYGLGWYGRVNIWQAVLLMGAIYAGQLALSPIWLRRFPLGPVEWIMRRLSYGPARPFVPPPPLPPPPAPLAPPALPAA